ncbi:MAG: aminoglycoside phosphotransferase family protein [Rhizobiales bacterium]|nr:aminoglycoside phosphotransferase family protein [Hyphomicrobiales bacterium]
MGLLSPGEPFACESLTGGVSSDIWKVATPREVLAVKRARAQLKVAAEWHAPVERNAYEVKWYRFASSVIPGVVPELRGEDRDAGLFAMRYLEPADYPIWKEELRDGRVDVAFAAEVGRRLATIQTAAARAPETPSEFATDATFHAIRLEAYLEATGRAHPRIGEALVALSRETLATKRTLVHGDVSPKNILVGPDGPVFLDAECAWYGDPAFDLAFCLKHLMLKCLWKPKSRRAYLAAFDAMAAAYLDAAGWEDRDALEARIAKLLPGLFLARADGKSPVEYLDETGRERVRAVAVPLVIRPVDRLAEVRRRWAVEVDA